MSRYGVIVQCACALLRAEWMVRRRPFGDTARQLSQPISSADAPEDGSRVALDVRGALASICRRLPWKPTCLVKAVAAHTVLGRRHVSSSLVLSVASGESITVNAHAWLEAAGIIVTGRSEMEKYVPIYRFENRPVLSRERVPHCSH